MSDPQSSEVQAVGKRAIALATVFAVAAAYVAAKAAEKNTDKTAIVGSITVAKLISQAIINAISIAGNVPYLKANTIAIANTISNTYASYFDLHYANANEISNSTALSYFIGYTKWVVKFKIYRDREQKLEIAISDLEELLNHIPRQGLSKGKYHDFDRSLIDRFLSTFNLNLTMIDLCDQEIISLEKYIYANCLLMECKHSAVTMNRTEWPKIEERMITPK
jgi:hypothetical protein